MKYTVGFIFNMSLTHVALVRKNRGPAFNIGRLNGVGGKIEVGESPVGCMVREAQEETGLISMPADWHFFHYERHTSGNEIRFYACRAPGPFEIAPAKGETETVTWRKVDWLWGRDDLAYNLCYLIPMALTYIKYPEHRYLED